jgi:2,3-dihydroxybiphenyl 1,2-dioxygenase
MVSVRALGYLGIEAGDLDRWAAFADGILGLVLAERGADGTLHLRMDERRQRICVHPGPADDLAYNGWEVASAAELAAVAGQLRDGGVTVHAGDADLCRERAVEGLIWCHDPNGLRTEVFHGALAADVPFVSPLGRSNFVTGSQGLGHSVLSVKDADANVAFYRDLLGFRLSDFITFEAQPGLTLDLTFLHCNSRHHSLAFVMRPGAPKRLSHMMIEVEAIDDVGLTFEACERAGVPIGMTLGRHTNDLMFSFYMLTPSSFMLEYGHGGRIVDDATWHVGRYDSASIWGHRRQPAVLAPAPQPERLLR